MSDAFPLFTRTRAEDPETSKQAAASVQHKLNALQTEVYVMLQRYPSGLTDLELATKLGDSKRSTYRTRRAELVEKGLVVWTGRHRTDEGTKRRVWTLSKYHAGVEVKKVTRPAPEAAAGLLEGLAAHIAGRHIPFSLETFGPDPRQGGVIDHIRKELREIEALAPDEHLKRLKEWIDVIILGVDGAWRSQIGTNQPPEVIAGLIIGAWLEKQAKNERRDWPDWRTMSTNQAIEHVRGKED